MGRNGVGWLDRVMRKESWDRVVCKIRSASEPTTATYILMTVAAQHKRESGRLSKIHPSFSLLLDRRVAME